MISLALDLVVSYLLGSIPTSIWVGRSVRHIDIREHGSKNAGATNTYRVLGWKLALVVALVDLAKGFVATRYVGTWAPAGPLPWADPVAGMLVCGLSAVLGHIWTVFAGFRGGKGVLTAAGLLLALTPPELLICLALFIATVKLSGYVSLGSILAAIAFPLLVLMDHLVTGRYSPLLVGVSAVLGLLIVFTHRANIRRLLNGTELRFGQKSAAPATDPIP